MSLKINSGPVVRSQHFKCTGFRHGISIRLMLVLLLLIPLALASAQDQKVVALEGVYDINQNSSPEIFTVRAAADDGEQGLMIRHLELDEQGFRQVLWELEFPLETYSRYVNLELVDLEGNGVPELVIALNLTEEVNGRQRRPVIYLFRWDGTAFEVYPQQVLDLSTTWGFLRANSMAAFDRNADGAQELVVALGSPRRSLVVIGMDEAGQLVVERELAPETLASGSGFIYCAAVDYDRDGYDDLLVYSPEGNYIKSQPYYNGGGSLIAGTAHQQLVPGLFGLLSGSEVVTDWNTDGLRDLILPFRSGHLITLTLEPTQVRTDEIVVDAGPLSDLALADFNNDDREDLLLVSGEMNLLALVAGGVPTNPEDVEYFTLESEDGAQVFKVVPVSYQGLYSGTILAASWDGYQADIFTSEIGSGFEPEVAPAQPVDSSYFVPDLEELASFPEIDAEEERPQPETVPQLPRTSGVRLPEGVLPRHLLGASQTFTYTIPEDDMRQFYSFRWLKTPPRGMFFHYESRSIQWIPTPDQLGAYQLAYQVEMQVGEDISLDLRDSDSLETYQVVPELESYEERLWVYVNDPPRIITVPEKTEFLANELFIYQPRVFDQNRDARIRYSLEEKPAGMVIDPQGLITWQTDSTHLEAYPVRLVASDGFDRDVQEFILHPRAGVIIMSEADTLARVGEQYSYQVETWQPAINVTLEFELLDAPDGLELSPEGRLSWLPTAAQIDSQYFAFTVRHGISSDTQEVYLHVNHPPIIRQAPAPIELIRLGETYDFQIQATDPNHGDVLKYTALLLPEGMRMDPYNGRLWWEPTEENVDFSQLLVAVSDGLETRMIEAEFFVNAPLSVVSLPTMQAEVGQPYTYHINTADINRGNLLTFDRLTPIEDLSAVRVYGVKIADDVYQANIGRYLGDWENAPAVYASTGDEEFDDGSVSRLDLKKYVHALFYEDNRLVVILLTIDQQTVSIKDVLWEFFQGSKGKPPKVSVERIPTTRFSLLEFPDGMLMDELTGTISWTPAPDQIDVQKVRLVASDGYWRDKQSFDIYVNHPPVIVSQAADQALVGEMYKYQIVAEDKNSDAELRYSLVNAPRGMQMNSRGRIIWTPKASQINNHKFVVKVSDGYREDVQTTQVYVNINPTVISDPKPVALAGYEYRYKLVVEDLNKDRINFRPLRLPKYAKFNPRSGNFTWKPRRNQKGINDVIIMVSDEKGAATSHEFQIHVFEDPTDRQMMNTGWPLLLTFVGVMFAWGVTSL